MFRRALRKWTLRRPLFNSCVITAGIALAALVSACGGGSEQNASEPAGNFPVTVSTASFPASQRLAQHTHLVIAVRNSGSKTIPNVAVTICNVTCAYPAPCGEGTDAGAFANDISQTGLANPSRPVWVVDQPPGTCGYSCGNGGPGGAVTAYSNTWALGALKPGATAKFQWNVTAVRPGKHVVAWQVAAGLNGKAKAVSSGGGSGPPHGTFTVTIHTAPAETYVTDSGKIVTQTQKK
jgi:hypothetical protein